jgi:hypothetical protein
MADDNGVEKLKGRLKVKEVKKSQDDIKLPNRFKLPDSHVQPFHSDPTLIPPVTWACVFCICSTTIVALYKIVVGSEGFFLPYALASASVFGCCIVLAAYFGKSSKSGAMQTK